MDHKPKADVPHMEPLTRARQRAAREKRGLLVEREA
jgi:hypothetical protein